MAERELLILGLLKAQSQHGYKINEFIEHNLGRVSDMKKATAYSILKRLEQLGLVSSIAGQEGNRPTKLIYSITGKGEARFESLLREVLSYTDDTSPIGDIGVMFIDHLPPTEVEVCLNERLVKVEQMISSYLHSPRHGNGIGVDLAINHRIKLLQADRDWLLEAIETIRKL